jgi:hypothetical protein
MVTATRDCQTAGNAERPAGGHIRACLRCGTAYDWRKSTSGSLKMTYCGTLCEIAGTGTTIESLLAATRPPRAPAGLSPG